jgi:predicted acylesterase/phospholipase RssA
MTPEVNVREGAHQTMERFRIGLALSGGGFRAAIFHLGVIRRLEELGIMKDVDVISCVSGGSIVAAYYVCQMEDRLRQLGAAAWRDTGTRVSIFEEIAADFLKGVDHNLRTRALIYTPFFHPWLFVKTLVLKAFRVGARSELIQREYDRWFYDRDTIDQLPSVTPARSHGNPEVLYGPRMILNTTSLLTGERVPFSRDPNSAMMEMKRSNKNSLPLSRVVGASSGVPVLFPPTRIFGDTLVDGGVADNQGIDALFEAEGALPPDDVRSILLVSDASGQLEAIHNISSSETTVFSRVNDILQFQVRSKLIDRLVQWKTDRPARRYFGFVHLFLNLKDRGTVYRLPAELIPGVARIRTDLDQFSLIERESLMYHGYTLIDAQVRQYCQPLVDAYGLTASFPMHTPPLFATESLDTMKKRDEIRKELETGAQKVFLLRSLSNYPALVAPIFAAWGAAWLVSLYFLFYRTVRLLVLTQDWFEGVLRGLTSGWVGVVLDWVLRYAGAPLHAAWIPPTSKLIGAAVIAIAAGYALSFPMYLSVRRLRMIADRWRYHELTGVKSTTRWGQPGQSNEQHG